jgi:ribosome-associated translation inhibitor RaiA
MQVLIEARDPRSVEYRDLAEHRVRFVMRRLAWMVSRAQVQLSDVNGPRGGVDKRCQVMLKTDGRSVLVISSTASDWRAALDAALARASRLLVRTWRRGRDPLRARGGRLYLSRQLAASN